MSVWLVRGDKEGQYHDVALEQGFTYVSFVEVPDLSAATTREEIAALVAKGFPGANKFRLGNYSAQVFGFCQGMKVGDLVVMPQKSRAQVAIGRVSGPYAYRSDLGGIFHTRPVEWKRKDVPRTAFKQDLLYSLGAFMTVCQIKRHNAESRIRSIASGHEDPGDAGGTGDGDNGETQVDVEQIARDQVLAYIKTNFKGHGLSRLVHAVLRAEGYVARMSPPGPDGGVDILAGRGPLGFENPKLCVQVKSSESPSDVTTLRALQGTMATFKADQGLLVSWGGFNSIVEKEAKLSFFSVRLWDANDLVEVVLRNYDKLPGDLQSELPLKRIWALVLEEE